MAYSEEILSLFHQYGINYVNQLYCLSISISRISSFRYIKILSEYYLRKMIMQSLK